MAEHYRSGVVGLQNMGEYGAASVDASWSDTDSASGENKRAPAYASSIPNRSTPSVPTCRSATVIRRRASMTSPTR